MIENNIDYNQNDQPSPGSTLIRDLTLINLARAGVNNHINDAQRKHKAAIEANQELQSELVENQKKARAIATKANELDDEVVDLEQTVAILRKEVYRLNELLSLPLSDIAEKHAGFADQYEKQMQAMSEWIVSQKALKELAIDLGTSLGLSVDEIVKKIPAKQLNVLENKNNPQHNTNILGSSIVTVERAKKIKDKMLVHTPSKEQSLANIQSIQEKTNTTEPKAKLSL